jgi:hypothetical protein
MLGNYLNASSHKGGAHGFKVTSINKLVDTKSAQSSNRTLLHFTAKTVTQTMPQTEEFLEELAKPAEAYKGSCRLLFVVEVSSLTLCRRSSADLSHVKVVLADLRSQQVALDQLLKDGFEDVSDLDPNDGFPKKMFRFAREANERILALTDLVTLASNTYTEALKFYGEDTKTITSTEEFFGVFKTFVTSYKVRPDALGFGRAR